MERLQGYGFTRYEARELSKVKKMPPYMQRLVASRAASFRAHKRSGKPDSVFFNRLREFYLRNGYYKTETAKGVPFKNKVKRVDPWQLFRAWEDRYKDSHKDYETPGKKSKQKQKDFDDRSLQHRPGE